MDKLIEIQSILKCEKGQKNEFGGFNFRSCEDILNAVKPLLKERKLTLYIDEETNNVGLYNYFKATAIISDGTEEIKVSAHAKEVLNHKKMDACQLSGSASSYAKKNALGGLFLIDNTKDSDATNITNREEKEEMVADVEYVLNSVKDLKELNSLYNEVIQQYGNDVFNTKFKSSFSAKKESLL